LDQECKYSLSSIVSTNKYLIVLVDISGAPSGLIKGMLLVKAGIDHIMSPKSMVKVKSSDISTDDFAYVVFKSMSAPSEPCKDFGKYLDPDQTATDSFMDKPQKKLSDMYVRMLVGLGLKPQQCKTYMQTSLKLDNVTLMGVADPTGSIPYGMIFIPGCELYEVFYYAVGRTSNKFLLR
jgi:hypothetical protein